MLIPESTPQLVHTNLRAVLQVLSTPILSMIIPGGQVVLHISAYSRLWRDNRQPCNPRVGNKYILTR